MCVCVCVGGGGGEGGGVRGRIGFIDWVTSTLVPRVLHETRCPRQSFIFQAESAKRASLRVVREDEAQRKEDEHRAVQTADVQQPEIGQMAIRKSSLPEKVVAACHVPEISKAKKSASPKSRIRWLKDPHLYKVAP